MQFLIILLDMIFKQLFDDKSSTYTYILASDKGREALIIDPVIEHTNKYLNVLDDLDLKLVKVIDTHIHADHVTGLNELSKKTNCTKIMGEKSKSEVVDLHVKEDDKIKIDNIELKVIYTPGHTDCSYSYLMNDRVFTGDTLLINGTGRTDFQNGSAKDQYDSPIGSELKNNPRLQVDSVDQYIEIMNNLNLANPKMMDIAVPANVKGLTSDQM